MSSIVGMRKLGSEKREGCWSMDGRSFCESTLRRLMTNRESRMQGKLEAIRKQEAHFSKLLAQFEGLKRSATHEREVLEVRERELVTLLAPISRLPNEILGEIFTLQQYDTSLHPLQILDPGRSQAKYFEGMTCAHGKTFGGGKRGFMSAP